MVQERGLSQAAFRQLQQLFHHASGILLPESKIQFMASRLRRRLAACAVADFDAYCQLLQRQEGAQEARLVVDLLTTNETYFFREPLHFQHLAQQVLPALQRGEIQVWCAAAASGEEAYSIAMLLDSQLDATCRWRLLASDLSQRMLARARQGEYPMTRLQQMPPRLLQRYCLRGTGSHAGKLRVCDALRQRVQFVEHNLMHAPGGLGMFDVIFMRNVLIYFDLPGKTRMVRLALQALRPGGWLYVGRSESLYGTELPLDSVQPSIYRKREA